MSRFLRSVRLLLATLLVGAGVTALPAVPANADPATHLSVTTSLTGHATAGAAFDVTVTARDANDVTDAGYTGTVHFSGGGTNATLPEDSTLTNGTATFSLGATLTQAGPQTISVADTNDGSITGSVGVTVDPPHLSVTTSLTGHATAGAAFDVTVTALDANDVTDAGYTGTVHFSGGGTNATLPADSTLTNGTATFSLGATLTQAGPQTISVADTNDGSINGSLAVTVDPGSPYKLLFISQPSDTYSARSTDPTTPGWELDFSVGVYDQWTNLETGTFPGNSDQIQATLSAGGFSGGTATQPASGGIATFNDLKVLAPGNYTISVHDIDTVGVTDATSVPFAILPHADLQLTMSSSGHNVAGLDQTYTVHVQNFGPNTNTSYSVSGALPANTTLAGSTGGCALNSGQVECTRTVGIADGASDSFDITLAVPSNYANGGPRDLSFTEALSATDPTQDPVDTDPNGATVTDQIHAEADMGVTAVSSSLPAGHPAWQSTPIAGTDQVFSATVKNFGPSDNQGYTFHLNVSGLDDPAGVTFVSAKVGVTTIACSDNDAADTVDCVRSAGLTASATESIDITLHIDPAYTDPVTSKSLLYTASVGALTPANQGATGHADSLGDSITVNAAADLAVSGAASSVPAGAPAWQTQAVAGLDQLFSATVSNNGPSDNDGYTFRLSVPDLGAGGVSYVSAATGSGPITCTPDTSNHRVDCTRPGLALNASETVTVRLAISASYDNPNNTKSLGFSATVVGLSPTDQGAGLGSDSQPGSTNVARVADLGIGVTFAQAGPTTYAGHDAVAGTSEVFHMTTTNAGPSDNGAFTATLTVPDYNATGPLTLISAPGCTGTAASHTVSCPSTTTLANGGGRTYDITFAIAASYTDPGTTKVLTFSAALSGLSPAAEGAATLPNATGPLNLNADAVADVSVSQTAAEQNAASFNALNPGNLNSVIYTVTVSNGGPSDAQNVQLKETLPSTLQTGSINYCVGSGCTPNLTYTNGTQAITVGAGGILAPSGSSVVRFQAPLVQSLRRGAAGSYPSGNATAVATTNATDPTPGNNTHNLSFDLFTVPDVPTLIQVQPGDQKIGVMWSDPATGGNAITGYDFIANGTAYFVPVGSTQSLGANQRSATFPISPANLTNGTTYTVTIEARNGAGDSSPSGSAQATPCAACVITQLTTSRTLLLSSNGTNQVITNPADTAKGCFPASQSTTAPGATTNDPKVSCLDIPAGVAASKVGDLVALRDEAAVAGDCPLAGHPCLNNQSVVAVPPGTGTSVALKSTIILDRTISTQIYGDPCNRAGCGKYTYVVYLRQSTTTPSIPIGSSVPTQTTVNGTVFPAWCPTVGGQPVIPSGKLGCVISYLPVNPSSSSPVTSSNGKQGNGDLRLTVLFYGDPRLHP